MSPARRKPADSDEKRSIQAALAELEQGDYGLTAEAVIEAARKPSSPLHRLFEWDVKRAAYQHWLVQAREVIGTYKVTTVTSTTTYKVPFYAHNPKAPAGQQGYVTVDQMRTDADLAHEHLVAEFTRVRSALDRARGYAVTLGRSQEIDGLIEQVVGIHQRFDDRNAA
jgi:hypothetical protein